MMRYLLWMVLASGAAWAQLPFGLGLKGGVAEASDASGFTIGPYAELKLPFAVSVESGLLFKRYGYTGTRRTAIEIPVLLKKRIGPFPVQPFLSGGATIRNAQRTDTGVTFGAGVTFHALVVKFEPEIRYTRYPGGTFPRGQGQTDFLLGIRF